jgi:hypothetical protein
MKAQSGIFFAVRKSAVDPVGQSGSEEKNPTNNAEMANAGHFHYDPFE